MHNDSMISRFEPNPQTYDYIFCGLGASASLLILAMHQKQLFAHKKVLLIDQAHKNKKDKTFCFWAHHNEPIAQQLKPLISKSWNEVELSNALATNISPQSYYHVDSIDLYQQVQALAIAYQWDAITGEVDIVSNNGISPYLLLNQTRFNAQTLFDSRTPRPLPLQKNQTHIHQSFVGWMIETPEGVINPAVFKFMDFDIDQLAYTQFIYILPFSANKALVELTRFGDALLQEQEAEKILVPYLQKAFGSYKKIGLEIGCIPMSNGAVDNASAFGIVNLGARNYHIKPSTGYAFKNMFYHALSISETLAQNGNASALNQRHAKVFSTRFAFYDSLLLHILKYHPAQGKPIFTSLLSKVPIQKTLKFLDEQTSLAEEVSIFYHLPWIPFLKALLHKSMGKSWLHAGLLCLLTLLLLGLGAYSSVQKEIGYALLLTGLVMVGIPHGAVDHLLETGTMNLKKTPVFIAKYIAWMGLMAALWVILPKLALLGFLLYSAWHFGEADGKKWHFSSLLSLLWGSSVLLYILGTHATETSAILKSMQVSISFPSIPSWALFPWALWGIRKKQLGFVLTILWLSLSSALPLLFAFGIYFIGQHSINGWKHIQMHLNWTHQKIWLQALPFHAGAWILLGLFYWLWPHASLTQDTSSWGLFFIFIACISFPHVIAMHGMYRRNPNAIPKF